jgi:hypothetical protein
MKTLKLSISAFAVLALIFFACKKDINQTGSDLQSPAKA